MATLKLISLNVERQKHVERIRPFLERERPDIFCAQELCETDVATYAKQLGGADHFFVRNARHYAEGAKRIEGIGIFSRVPMRKKVAYYYHGDADMLPDSRHDDEKTYNYTNRFIALGDVEKDGALFRILTTHFTWSPRGAPTDEQRRDMYALLPILGGLDEFVLCGDFNLPRGGELFAELAHRYTDNIPPKYKTSLDLSLHRAGATRPEELADKMVDGLFTTPGYSASEVRLVDGLSDHCAIVATITREMSQ